MRKVLKICRKILFWIFFVCLFLLTTVTIILNVYEDDIKQYAIDELNEHLKTKVEVEDIELSIFHDFPSASIQFQKVFIPDAFPEIESDDTLFYAEDMFFNFNIMDIYSGNYEVKRISVHEGCLQMKTAENGERNYEILKEKESSSDDDKFSFMLDLLAVENFKYSYNNVASSQLFNLDFHEGLFSGNFSETTFDIEADADLKIQQLKSGSFNLVQNKESKLDLNLTVETLTKSYIFNKGNLLIEEMPFDIHGRIDSTYLDLAIIGDGIKIHDLANSLVDEKLEDVKSYEGEGIINFNAAIIGQSSATEMPSIMADFDIVNGSIIEPKNDLQITDISFKGSYQNEQKGRKEELTLTDLHLKLLQSYFSGSAVITDFHEPLLSTKMDGDLDLARFHQFFNFNNVEKLSGKVVFNFNGQVRFFDPEYRAERFEVLKSNGTFNLTNVAYKSRSSDLAFTQIGGQIVLKDKDAATKNLIVKTGKSDLKMNGAMKNLIPFIEGSGSLGLIAAIESQNIDLDEFLGEPNKSKTGPLEMFVLPDNLNLNVSLDVAKLKWENHNFQNISSKVLMSSRKVNMNQLRFDMLGGQIRGNLSLNNLLDNGNVIEGKMHFNKVNVTSLFAEWDNFDQKSITSKHLSGNATGDIDFLLGFNPYFSIIEDKIFADCDVKISNGELNNLETMKSITDYMRSNKGLNLLLKKHIDSFEEKLLHLKFSDIENHITIQDRKITIPKMKIKTNAIDIDLAGWHDFDNQIDYHFSFRFRELKTRAEETEFGIVEDDGLGLLVYLRMFGDLDDPSYALDKENRKADIKEQLAEEKQDVKSMLKSEFGFFKKDSTVKNMEAKNKKEVQFIFYDDEIENTDLDSNETKKEDKHKKRTFKFYEKLKADADKNKDKVDFEIEK
ncbi:MAG: AsmA-like C-terminal region-containing protein [Crocinitomicaceae bacterium]